MTPQRKERIEKVLGHRQPDLTVILENVHDPHNIAAVMRTCDAVGVQDIYVLNTRIAKHGKFGKRSSASAAGWLSVYEYDNVAECMEAVKKNHDHIYATHLGEQAVSLYELNLTERVALVFGNEHSGVSEECLGYCTGNFIIPQVGMVQSLNISVACAVTLYEAYRQREAKGYYSGVSRLGLEYHSTLAERWGLETENTNE